MAEYDHVCLICGAQYRHCNGCRHTGEYLPWRAIVDKPECYQVYTAWKMYQAGEISDEQMREVMVDRGFEKGSIVHPAFQPYYDELMGKGEPTSDATPVADKEQADGEVPQPTQQINVVEGDSSVRKRNHKRK